MVRSFGTKRRNTGYRPQGSIFAPVCHSVHRGGVCPIACWDTPPGTRGRHPPQDQRQAPPGPEADLPPGADTPPEQNLPPPGTKGRHPPRRSACWEIRATSGRYASYCSSRAPPTGNDLMVQMATFLCGIHLQEPEVHLNLGESASGGTGTSISTLFAVDCFLNWLLAFIMYSMRLCAYFSITDSTQINGLACND